MWLTSKTRPDIAATLGILASQMLIRPGYVKDYLVHLWRYVTRTRHFCMHSLELGSMTWGSLIQSIYVAASFATGGGKNKSGLTMYLVNPTAS